ncbi:MAG: hypothetical protein IPI88_07435 [Chitinophagaceae bacterium]|nr:hypothetical protein [Chitinophagaceae bacterium]
MKKIYTGILAFVYLAVSSGIALELHYCMGEKAGIDLYGSSSDTCGKCGMSEKDTGCCHDEFKFYKISDSHKTVSNDIDLTASSIAIINDYHFYNWQIPDNTAIAAVNNHSPPDYTKPDVCIMNGVFRI